MSSRALTVTFIQVILTYHILCRIKWFPYWFWRRRSYQLNWQRLETAPISPNVAIFGLILVIKLLITKIPMPYQPPCKSSLIKRLHCGDLCYCIATSSCLFNLGLRAQRFLDILVWYGISKQFSYVMSACALHERQFCDMWHPCYMCCVIFVMWHVKCNMWEVTCVISEVRPVGRTVCQNAWIPLVVFNQPKSIFNNSQSIFNHYFSIFNHSQSIFNHYFSIFNHSQSIFNQSLSIFESILIEVSLV